jgi:hypothetical protein
MMSPGGADVKYRCAIDTMRRRYDPKRHARYYFCKYPARAIGGG